MVAMMVARLAGPLPVRLVADVFAGRRIPDVMVRLDRPMLADQAGQVCLAGPPDPLPGGSERAARQPARAALTGPHGRRARRCRPPVRWGSASARDERDRALSGDGTRPCSGGWSGGRNLAGKAVRRETLALITTLGGFS